MLSLRSLTLLQPPRVTFGAGCAAETAAAFVRERGLRRVLIATSPSVRAQAQAIGWSLAKAGVVVSEAGDVPPEPTVGAVEKLRAESAAFSPDLVLGIGGGSVLDAAKLAAALHGHEGPVSSYFGQGLLPPRRTAFVAVPTTAGTGSEVSPNSLLYDETTRSKKAVISPWLVPDAAIIDPRLTLSLPAGLTATTGIDALTHCLEVYANLAAHPATDPNALEGVRLVGAHLARAVADGSDLEARSALALASLYGGLGLGPVNTAGVHALAYPLGGEFHMAHGLSIALLLPHVVRFNAPAMPARYAALARALGEPAGSSEEAAAAACADRLAALMDASRIPPGLGANGIPRDALPRLADAALGVTRLLKNNPRAITRDDALGIYEAAF